MAFKRKVKNYIQYYKVTPIQKRKTLLREIRMLSTFCCSALLFMFNEEIFSLELLNYYGHLSKSPTLARLTVKAQFLIISVETIKSKFFA